MLRIETSVGKVINYNKVPRYVHLAKGHTPPGDGSRDSLRARLCHLWRLHSFYSSLPHVARVIRRRQIGGYFSAQGGHHCTPPLGPTPTPAIMNVFFILLINGTGPPPFSRVISLWLYGMSTWAPKWTGEERRACKAAKG